VWAVGEWVPTTSNTCDWGTAIVRLTFTAPTIKSLNPSSGPPYGSPVDIKGTDFVFYQNVTTVKFGTQSVSFTVVSPNEILTAAPRSTATSFPSTVSVTVTTPDGTSDGTAASAQYTYRVRSESTVNGPPAAPVPVRSDAPPRVPPSTGRPRPLTPAQVGAISDGVTRVFMILRLQF
jgi:hypothetical protein